MGTFEDMLKASKMNFNPNEPIEGVLTSQEVKDITQDSSREEILDWIMIFICERIDRRYSYFKGGYVLTKMLPHEARLTEDIDFSIKEEEQYVLLKEVFNELGTAIVNKGIGISYTIKDTITPTSSGGINIETDSKQPNIKIDVGWHDMSYGVTAWNCLGFDCNRFEVERMLSDKLSAIYSPKRFRRTKDIYDFYILTNNFDVNFKKLNKYIELRGLIDYSRDPFRMEVAEQYAINYDKIKLQHIDGTSIAKPEFRDILSRLKYFIDGLRGGAIGWSSADKKVVR